MNVPTEWTVVPEDPRAGSIPGYDDLDVRFEAGTGDGHQQIVRFLLSKDRKRLAKLANFDLDNIQGTKISTSSRPILGTKDAPVEIVDFDDLQCPFCANMNARVLPPVLAHYKGLVKIVYKDFPLVDIHPWAMHAAVDAGCLAAQSSDAYWSFVETVHARNADIIGRKDAASIAFLALDTLAKEKGNEYHLDEHLLDTCVSKQNQSEVLQSIQDGNNLKVHQTPTLFISGERFVGKPSQTALYASIDRALRSKGFTPPPAD